MNKYCVQQLSKYLELQNINDIIEVTYAYQKIGARKYYNKTLFDKFGGISLEKFKKEKYDYYTIHSHIKRQLEAVKKGLGDFQKENHYRNINKEYRRMVDKAIKYMQGVINLAILGTPFEIEKTGMKIPLTQRQVNKRVREIKTLEKKLFGVEVKQNIYEINNSYILLYKIYNSNSFMLTPKEKKRFKSYLQLIKDLPKFTLNETQIKNRLKQPKVTGIFDKHQKLFHTLIPRKDYIKVFTLCMKIYNIKKRIVVDERSSIYDGSDALHIPKDNRYSTIKLQSLITLIAHEIETHFLIEKNHRKLFSEVRGGWNLPKEEGLAIIHERFVQEKDINKFTSSKSLVLTLMGELLHDREHFKFLRLYFKLHGSEFKKSSIMRYLRQKRNYPYRSTGVQHKDVTYTRGAKQIIDYLKKGRNYEDLYIAKVHFRDIPSVKRVMEEEKITINHTKFIAERIKLRLLGIQCNQLNFHKYLNQKYPFLSMEEIQKIHHLTIKQQSYLNNIQTIIKKHIKDSCKVGSLDITSN